VFKTSAFPSVFKEIGPREIDGVYKLFNVLSGARDRIELKACMRRLRKWRRAAASKRAALSTIKEEKENLRPITN
jgi:hypothetical protein